VFRFELAVPITLRRADQAPRVLQSLERLLQDRGATTRRAATTLDFTGGIVAGYRYRHAGRGSISWHDPTASRGPRFVLEAWLWREVLMVLGCAAIVGPPACWGGRLSAAATIQWLALGTGLVVGVLLITAGLQMLWLRGRLAATIARVAA
jgi:hypothetical protein